jgi:hypothetical protein
VPGDVALLKDDVDSRFDGVHSDIEDLRDDGCIVLGVLRLILPRSLTSVMIYLSNCSGVRYSLPSVVG